jgi:ribonuclease R
VKLTQFHEHFSHDEENHTLEGKRTGRTFRLGDTVKVQLISADMNKRQIDFKIAKRGEKSDL